MAKKKTKEIRARKAKARCLVCKKSLASPGSLVKHYKNSPKCYEIRNDPRVLVLSGTKTKEAMIDAIWKGDKIPQMKISEKKLRAARKVGLNFCPNCGMNLQGIM